LSFHSAGTLLSLPLAGLVAWQLGERFGGVVGNGVLGGYLLGAAIAGLGFAWQQHTLRVSPKKAMGAFVTTFFFKLVFLMIGCLALRYIERAGQLADWKSFILAYVAAMLVVGALGTFDTMNWLKQRTANRPLKQGEVASR
jgi:hypothetical protein